MDGYKVVLLVVWTVMQSWIYVQTCRGIAITHGYSNSGSRTRFVAIMVVTCSQFFAWVATVLVLASNNAAMLLGKDRPGSVVEIAVFVFIVGCFGYFIAKAYIEFEDRRSAMYEKMRNELSNRAVEPPR